jgi:hypothetical protein
VDEHAEARLAPPLDALLAGDFSSGRGSGMRVDGSKCGDHNSERGGCHGYFA